MTDAPSIKRVTGFAPVVMSLIALAVLVEGVFQFGHNPPADEGWQAHIFQIMMVAQIPIILLFIVNSWRSLKQNLPVLVAQVFFFLLALGALRVSGY